MSSAERGLSARSLAELALVISRVARTNLDSSTLLSTEVLRTLWQGTRALEQRWTKSLLEWTIAGTFDLDLLAELTPRIFTCEMLVRVWSTAIAGSAVDPCRDDLVRVARNALNSLSRVRNGVLARFLTVPQDNSVRVAELDRLRRRCDRWTDVLIGCMAVRSDCYEFAFDQQRARDFSEESLNTDPAAGPNVAEHFVSAGLRLNFIRHLPTDAIDEPEIVTMIQSILSCIPEQTFHRDGTFRTLMEHRIAGGRHRVDQPAKMTFTPFIRGGDDSL